MTDSEKTAFELFMSEALERRAMLIHEQRCIEEAATILRQGGKLAASGRTDAEKVDVLCGLIDSALAALFRREVER